jgi:hypothetical protein
MFEICDDAKRDIETMDWVSGDIPTEGGVWEKRGRKKEKNEERDETIKFGGWESEHRRKKVEGKKGKETPRGHPDRLG